MARIPEPGGGTVADRLRATTESAIALADATTWFRFSRQPVKKPYDILESLQLFFQDLDFDQGDVALFAAKVIEYFTSSPERRLGQYEAISWWQFLDGDRYSQKFQRELRAVPRTMVAMDPKNGSALTVGDVSMQLFLDYTSSGTQNDRTMGGPTSQMWIDPWIALLAQKGVGLHLGANLASFELVGNSISGVKLGDGTTITADYYVLAVPIDAAIPLITPQMATLCTQLKTLAAKDPNAVVGWMSGIQYFLYEDVPMVRGHTFYPDSPWALTSISQPQFWRDLGLFRRLYGDGQVGGLISVDISVWDQPGTFIPKAAKDCTRDEIAQEVWAQLKAGVNGATAGEQTLVDEVRHSYHLDDDIDTATIPPTNRSRLLIHPPGSWQYRPDASTDIPNLMLAGDYIRTYTNLATMEGANEAARRAVNAILDSEASTADRAGVWPLVEPDVFEPWKALDRRLFEHGKPHIFELMGIQKAAQAIDLVRRFSAFTGLSKLDDLLDQVKATDIIRGLLTRLGVPQ